MAPAGLVPYYNLDINAPFSVALGQFYPWSSYIISIGACAGTFNSAFAALYAMSRLMVVLSRCRLIPHFLVSWQKFTAKSSQQIVCRGLAGKTLLSVRVAASVPHAHMYVVT